MHRRARTHSATATALTTPFRQRGWKQASKLSDYCHLKIREDSKQVPGQMNWLDVSTGVGQIRNVDERALGMLSERETSSARRARLVLP